jgi:hypothetical protein
VRNRTLVVVLAAACALAAWQGCGRIGCDRTGSERGAASGAPAWRFDGTRMVLAEDGTPITGPLVEERWAAVVDADSRSTAWLQLPPVQEPRLEEIEPGRRWAAEGFIRGPGADKSEVLRDNKLIRYKWEMEVKDSRSLSVTYSAQVLQHVVLTSYSCFTIRLPLPEYAGARAVIDGAFGGVITRGGPPVPCHPSYWEGPLRAVKILAEQLTLEMAIEQGSFKWVSVLDGRALEKPEQSLIVQLYPSLAGEHTRLGTLAPKGTSYAARFTLSIGAPSKMPPAPPATAELRSEEAPAPLPEAVAAELGAGAWELEPFLSGSALPSGSSVSLGQNAKWCNAAIGGLDERYHLHVGGGAPPEMAFIAVRGPVEGLRLKINGHGDCRDGREIVQEIQPAPEGGRALAEAVWRYAAGVTYPMPLHPTDDLGEFMSSYGYGFSSTLSAMALVRLWGYAGLPARRVYLSGERGYAIAEAYYGGDWHAFDLADRAYYVDPSDLSVASASELVSRPDLVSSNSDAEGAGPGGEPAVETANEKYVGAGTSYNIGGITFERLTRISLASGELLLRIFRPEGHWAPSPREPYNYVNALLAFLPDFREAEALDGFSNVDNFTLDAGALVPENPAAPASVEYRARSPYVIVESKLAVGAGRALLQRLSVLLSTDDGETWKEVAVDSLTGTADLTPYLVPGPQEPGTAYETLQRSFDFRLHLELAPAADAERGGVKSLSVLTWTQANPALLPVLRGGSNEVEIKCASWSPGASASLGWIEGDVIVEPDPAFTEEGFSIGGGVVNAGEKPLGELEVRAYAETESGRVEVGTWRAGAGLTPGDVVPFKIACGPIDPEFLSPDAPVNAIHLSLEAREGNRPGAPLPWHARYSTSVPLRNRPDLVLHPDLVSLSRPDPQPGEEIGIAAVVRNYCPTRDLLYMGGTTSPAADVELYELHGEERFPVQRVTVPEMQPGSVARALFKWTAPAEPGTVRLLVVADPDSLIVERDETNTAVFHVTVAPARP